MIKRILLFALLASTVNLYAQNPKQLLKESYSKCLTVKNGYYNVEMKMKFMDRKDTSSYGQYKFYFKKLQNDSIYSIAFNSELFESGGAYIKNTLYTGNDFVSFSKKDSTATIMSKANWIKTLIDLRHNYTFTFYGPITDSDCSPLPKASDYSDNKHFFKFIGKEIENNISCYHVQVKEYPTFDSTQVLYDVENKYEYWINCEDMIPIKYSISSKILQLRDTLIEYASFALKEYNLNDPRNLVPLQLSAIPSYCNIRDYVERKKIDLLSEDTIAPEFTLKSIQAKSVSLRDYKGHLIVLDFFYKECYPCLKALPVLQSLHEKYHDKGLEIIGIDPIPIDMENGAIQHFISKAGITYTILLDDKNVYKDYHVSSYPTLYLIDKKGKIIFATSGFDESMDGKLEYLIKSSL